MSEPNLDSIRLWCAKNQGIILIFLPLKPPVPASSPTAISERWHSEIAYITSSPSTAQMGGPNSPTRYRSNTMHARTEHLPANGFAMTALTTTTNGHGNGFGRPQRKGGWGIFEEKKSWIPSFARNDMDLLRTAKAPSWWQNFHLFEAPRRRGGLTSSNAPPSMLKFCFLCAIWYSTSAMSSNTGKAILEQFRFPITLTFIQFGFVAGYCLLFTSPIVRFTRLRRPTRETLKSTSLMGVFQVGGHIFSSMAISRIPVSTVHTIKALSPLFTVAAYALLFGVKYSPKTYISLLPLTVGVMLACSAAMSVSNAIGLLCAFGSALVFVTSNILFKKIMPSTPNGAPASHKLDKLNLLFYSSSMAFLLMIPLWLYYDLPALLSRTEYVTHPSSGHTSPHSVAYYFFLNGTVHFGQNIIAFIILSSTSPVTYSIASLFKRVAVICIAIVWFNQSVHFVQGVGIALTFAGLWMYNNAKTDVEKGENKMRRVEAARDMILPSTKAEHRMMHASSSPALSENEEEPISVTSALERPHIGPLLPPPPRPGHAHHNPDLHIHTAPVVPMKSAAISIPPKPVVVQSPTDSYPSPPLSLDSPPPSSIRLESPPPPKSRRRGTLTHPHVHARSLSREVQPASVYVNA